MQTILVCEDSFEGILTGIYEAYERKLSHDDVIIETGGEENFRLFSEYIEIKTDEEKAVKVSRSLRRMLGDEVVYDLHNALASEDTERGNAVYHTVVEALNGKGRNVMSYLQNDSVRKVFELSRNVWVEIHHMYGFLRFEELEGGILYAVIAPKNNIISRLMPHFSDRFPLENFVIYDEKRDIYAIHPAKGQWFLVREQDMDDRTEVRVSEDEGRMQELFKSFVRTIAIESRTNEKLQLNMLPLRFRPYMTEFR